MVADMFPRFLLLNVAALVTLAALPKGAAAHLPGFRTRAVPSADGKFLLVSLMPAQERQQRSDPSNYDPKSDGPMTSDGLRNWQENVDAQKAIEATYSQSGLYRNDGSRQLL